MFTIQRRTTPWLNSAGHVLLTPNHLALLHGLYDRPDGTAHSRVEWIRASLPYATHVAPYRAVGALTMGTRTIRPTLVDLSRVRGRIRATLTEQGRGIVEQTVAAHVVGVGPYRGLRSVADAEHVPVIDSLVDAAFVREAHAYDQAFGLPLLAKLGEPSLVAVSSTVGRPLEIVSAGELTLLGPRLWHYEWTRMCVSQCVVPPGYDWAFSEYAPSDRLNFLREVFLDEDRYRHVYARAYWARSFLSRASWYAWAHETIDFRRLDMTVRDARLLFRSRCDPFIEAAMLLEGRRGLKWVHPDTGKTIGTLFHRDPEDGESSLYATTPAAVACFQEYCRLRGLGIGMDACYDVTALRTS